MEENEEYFCEDEEIEKKNKKFFARENIKNRFYEGIDIVFIILLIIAFTCFGPFKLI